MASKRSIVSEYRPGVALQPAPAAIRAAPSGPLDLYRWFWNGARTVRNAELGRAGLIGLGLAERREKADESLAGAVPLRAVGFCRRYWLLNPHYLPLAHA